LFGKTRKLKGNYDSFKLGADCTMSFLFQNAIKPDYGACNIFFCSEASPMADIMNHQFILRLNDKLLKEVVDWDSDIGIISVVFAC